MQEIKKEMKQELGKIYIILGKKIILKGRDREGKMSPGCGDLSGSADCTSFPWYQSRCKLECHGSVLADRPESPGEMLTVVLNKSRCV